MAASPKDRFEAAVKVVRSLPKEGSFQPSPDLMLKFYAYYKQATLGPCSEPKPSFWEVVKKAKWEAWNKLGQMTPEDAMTKYVEELKTIMIKQSEEWSKKSEAEIVEAMPQTDNVTDFVETLDNFYQLVDEKPPAYTESIRKKTLGEPDKEAILEASEENEDKPLPQSGTVEILVTNGAVTTETVTDTMETSVVPSVKKSLKRDENRNESEPIPQKVNGLHADSSSDTESEVYCDTSDQPDIDSPFPSMELSRADSDTSTPLRTESNVRVPQIKTEADVHFWTMSPVSASNSNSGTPNLAEQGLNQILNTKQFNNSWPSNHRPSNYDNEQTSNVSGQWDYPSEVDSQSEPPELMVARGGGDTPPASGQRRPRAGSGASTSSSQRGGATGSYQPSGQHSQYSYGGGGGAGGQGNRGPQVPYTDMNEQIAGALVRLQQDMNSVLTRLNTLETLSIVQNQVRSQNETEEDSRKRQSSWWPFPSSLPLKTVMFLLVWPFVAQWIINVIRRRRRFPKK